MPERPKPTQSKRRRAVAPAVPRLRRATSRDRTINSGGEVCIISNWMLGKVVAKSQSEKLVVVTDGTTTVGPLAIPLNLAESIARHGEAMLHLIQSTGNFIESKGGVLTPDNSYALLFKSYFMEAALRGYYQALLHNVGKLQLSAEAIRERERRRVASRKGGAARSKQAEPNHKAIRARFRALKKSVPKKTARYARLAAEFTMSERNVQRIVDGLD